MKTINEEIQKIKHLFKFKKGDRLVMENTEMCEKVDEQSPSYVPPLCSELDGVKKLVPILPEYGLYSATLSNGCPKKCVKTKKDQENYNKNKNKFSEKNISPKFSPEKSDFFNIDIKGGDPNAGEIQKYLVDKGYLPRYRTEKGVKKDNIDWDFGDISAKAFGDFIKDKLGIDVGIQSLQDLQDYLDSLGFDTGSLGFGGQVYKGLVWLVKFIEKGATAILNNPEYNEIIKKIISNLLTERLYDTTVVDIDGKYIEGKDWKTPDVWLSTSSFITDISIWNLTDKTVSIDGSTDGHLEFKVGHLWGDNWIYSYPQQYLKMDFDLELNYYFKVKDGKFCIMVELVSASVENSSDINIKPIIGQYFIDIIMNKVNLHSGGPECRKNICYNKIMTLETLKVEEKIKKKLCKNGYCLKIDDIIKLIRGEEDISNLSNLMVDMCPPPPESDKKKKTTKTSHPDKHSGKSLDQRSREMGGGSFYHPGKI